jgi:anti-sigma-K factor RskA
MATFDKLRAEQQAILELVLQRGRSYDELSDMLEMSTSRVRELARDALAELAPVTADRVDQQRRDELADYILGQQSGSESRATRAHLRRSENARAWTLSLLDSLDELYEDGTRPEIPAVAEDLDEDRSARLVKAAERERGQPRRDRADKPRREARPREPARRPLSPAAQEAVRRRRLFAAGGAAVVIIVLAVLAITGVFGGGDDEKKASPPQEGQPAAGQPKVLAQMELTAVGGGGDNRLGAALIAEQGNQQIALVRARVDESKRGEKYELWLHNSDNEVASLGQNEVGKDGILEVGAVLPPNFRDFRSLDISIETNDDQKHQGKSVLRGDLRAALEAGPPPQPETGAPGAGGGLPGGAAPGGAPPGGAPPGGAPPGGAPPGGAPPGGAPPGGTPPPGGGQP